MRLIEVKLANFRGYAAETTIKIDNLTILVGRNDAGKSSVLDALDIFFNGATMESDDCCVRTNSKEVKISCVFDEFPQRLIIDSENPTTLKDEHLLRSDGNLEIVHTFQCTAAKNKVKAIHARASHPTAEGVADLLTLTNSKLKTRARQRNVVLDDVNEAVNAQLRAAIWNQCEDLQLSEVEVDLQSETGKQVWEQLQKHLPVYALFKSDRTSTDQDNEAKDPIMAAVKEAVQSRIDDLNGVIGEITAEVQKVADRTVEKIREMNPELANQMNPRISNKNWDSLFSFSLTGDDQISINKRGSGTRRLVLLNFFRAKAEDAATSRECGVIYAVEEPETSQHPNHQLMLLKAFQELTEQGGCQVILTTHTPTLARRVDPASLRLIYSTRGIPEVLLGSDAGVPEQIIKTLGILPDHDVRVFLGVEGKHDIDFLTRLSRILAASEADIPDLGQAEAKGHLVFVPLGGSSLDLWADRLCRLNRPRFFITDRDNQPQARAKYQDQVDDWNNMPDTKAWVTGKRELENYLHPDVIKRTEEQLGGLTAGGGSYAGTVGGDFEDVPDLFARAVTQSGHRMNAKRAKKYLNTTAVDQMTPALLTVIDTRDEIRGWLRAVKVHLDKEPGT